MQGQGGGEGRPHKLSELNEASLDFLYGPLSDLLTRAGLGEADVEDVLQYTRAKLLVMEGETPPPLLPPPLHAAAPPLVAARGGVGGAGVEGEGEEGEEEGEAFRTWEGLVEALRHDCPWFEDVNAILDTLLTSEHNFIATVQDVLVKVFLDGLRKPRGEGSLGFRVGFRAREAATPDEIRAIFSNLESLVDVNQRLLDSLLMVKRDRHLVVNIAKQFDTIAPFFKLYTLYINNYSTAIDTVKGLVENNSAFAERLEELEQQASDDTGAPAHLVALLALPLNRVPKYTHFFEAIRNTLPPHSECASAVSHTLQGLQELDTHVNKALVVSAHQHELARIAPLVGLESLIQPERCFVWEGRCAWEHANRTFHDAHVFVFNDLLLACVPQAPPRASWRPDRGDGNRMFTVGVSVQVNDVRVYFPTAVSIALVTDTHEKLLLLPGTHERAAQWEKALTKAIAMNANTRVFGLPLEVVMGSKCETGAVPQFVTKAIAYLTDFHLGEVGLFRKPGSTEDMQILKRAIDTRKEYTLQGCDPHVVGSLLKLFLRQLPRPLLSPVYTELLDIAARSPPPPDVASELAAVVNRLDPHTTALLCVLLAFLREVSRFAATNLMTVPNLALVFGPTVLSTPNEGSSINEAMRVPRVNRALELLIDHSEALCPLDQ